MSFDEFIPNWIYTFMILPILILFQRQFSIKTRVSVLESQHQIYIEMTDMICENQETLLKEVHILIGKLDEHLRK